MLRCWCWFRCIAVRRSRTKCSASVREHWSFISSQQRAFIIMFHCCLITSTCQPSASRFMPHLSPFISLTSGETSLLYASRQPARFHCRLLGKCLRPYWLLCLILWLTSFLWKRCNVCYLLACCTCFVVQGVVLLLTLYVSCMLLCVWLAGRQISRQAGKEPSRKEGRQACILTGRISTAYEFILEMVR